MELGLPLFLLLCIAIVGAQGIVFDVHNLGAVADGKTDNTKAFSGAWSLACQSKESSVVLVPIGTYLVGSVRFEGPCMASNIWFDVRGIIKAPNDGKSPANRESWLTFENVNGLTLTGGGTLDGQGASAWPFNACPACNRRLPTSLLLISLSNLNVYGINSINSKKFHMTVARSNNVKIDHVTITAPGDSPNTDGIHISDSTNVNITDSRISTGDDCISIGPGTKFLQVSNVACGPGHGISIGSIGRDNEDTVTGVLVQNCNISGTTNGLRIKTWAPSRANLINNITFENIFVEDCDNPINIHQQYCPHAKCDTQTSRVQISDVRFRNIWGRSRTKVAVNLLCSKKVPCQNVELKDINIAYYEARGGPATSYCANVKGFVHGLQQPPVCVQGQNNNMQRI